MVYAADGSLYGEAVDSVESYVARTVGTDVEALGEAVMAFSDAAYDYLLHRDDEQPSGGQASADVEVNADGTVKTEVSMTDNNVQATVPAGVAVKDGTTSLVLCVNEMDESEADVTVGENETAMSLNVHVDGVAESNTKAILVNLGEILPVGLNMGNVALYHVEEGETVEMARVLTMEELDEHNEYYYDPITGEVTVALASFSEIAVVSDDEAKWEGEYDYTWYDAAKTELTIANADQLAGLSAIVGGMDGRTQDSFAGKTIKLACDIAIGDTNSENGMVFYPIGYYNSDGTYEKTNTAISSGFKTFEGTFDGNGHTVSDFCQNTWEMKGDHEWYDATLQYYRDGMGLFGKVYGGTVKNLTIDNFSSDGEITTTGCVAAYADCGATFENIAITNCNPRVYNIGNGGIVGCVGWYTKEATDKKVTFTNITVDNSNKISALWGSWDVACGGIVGQYYPTSGQTSAGSPKNAGVHFENCHVAAQIDVNNDVCANYQYYAYRYAGMIIGSIRENETIDGHVYPKMDGITAKGCTVNYGDWNHYWYCELVANSLASYTHDHQFSRLTKVDGVDAVNKMVTVNGETTAIPESGRYNYVVVADMEKPEEAVCYHFVDGEVWNHEDAGTETVNGETVLKEDKQHYYLPFVDQLFTGYGWGVTSRGIRNYAGIVDLAGGITEDEENTSVEKFRYIGEDTYYGGMTLTVGELFEAIENAEVEIDLDNVQVFVSAADEKSTVSGTYTANAEDWTKGTLTISGEGAAIITITDYYYCKTTTANVLVKFGIATEDDLLIFSNRVNAGETGLDAGLVADIELTVDSVDTDRWVSYRNNYTYSHAIGSLENPYSGTFDGRGHKIAGLNMYVVVNSTINGTNATAHAVGLFGATDGATIRNITVGGILETDKKGGSAGNYGGLIGKATDTVVENCINEVTIKAYGYGMSYLHNVGGVIGYAEGVTMRNCGNEGTLDTRNTQYAGGLIGYMAPYENPTTVEMSYNIADIVGCEFVGGLVGYIKGCTAAAEKDLIKDCYSLGDVGSVYLLSDESAYRTQDQGGTLLGHYDTASFAIENCYTTGTTHEVDVADSTYGIVHHQSSNKPFTNLHYLNIGLRAGSLNGNGVTAYTAEADMQTREFADAMGDAFLYVENSFPILKWQCKHTLQDATYTPNGDKTHTVKPFCGSCGSSTGESYEERCEVEEGEIYCMKCGTLVEGAVFDIATAEDLLVFSALVQEGHTDMNARLTADITLNVTNADTDRWVSYRTAYHYSHAIGSLENPYSGTFDGQGHTISGLDMMAVVSATIDGVCLDTVEHTVGLFGVTKNATIKNVIVDGVLVAQASSSDKGRYGGLIGKATDTTVENCVSKVDIAGYSGLNYGVMLSNYGGLIGYAEGVTMDKCGFEGSIDTYNTRYVGGLIGHVVAYAEPTTVMNSYNTADIVGGSYVGGISGYIDGCTTEGKSDLIKNCYSHGDIASIKSTSVTGTYATVEQGGTLFGSCASSASFAVENCYTTGTTHEKDTTGKTYGVARIDVGNPSFANLHYLNVGLKATWDGDDGVTAHSEAAEMQTEEFAATMGDAFVHVAGDYPILVWQQSETNN